MKKVCKQCGTEFEPYRGRDNHVFCHRNCKAAHDYQSNPYKKEKQACQYCKKEFYPRKRGRSQLFCSYACGSMGRDGPTKRSKEGNNTHCSSCGKQLYRKPFLVGKSSRFFCSVKCHAVHKQKNQNGKSNPNYRNIQPKKCVGCGKEFKSYNKDRKYCSPECSAVNAPSETMANLRKGYQAEKKCQKLLALQGYHTCRSAGSKGEYDVIAVSHTEILLIQVKSTSSEQPSRIFPKKAVERLEAAHCPNGCAAKKQMRTLVKNAYWKIKEV